MKPKRSERGDGDSDNEGRARQSPRKKKQDDDHEHSGFDEVASNRRGGGGVDDVGLVIKGNDLCAVRQLEAGDLLLDLLDDLLAVFLLAE